MKITRQSPTRKRAPSRPTSLFTSPAPVSAYLRSLRSIRLRTGALSFAHCLVAATVKAIVFTKPISRGPMSSSSLRNRIESQLFSGQKCRPDGAERDPGPPRPSGRAVSAFRSSSCGLQETRVCGRQTPARSPSHRDPNRPQRCRDRRRAGRARGARPPSPPSAPRRMRHPRAARHCPAVMKLPQRSAARP
jgi:hypothetical protein